MNNGENVCALYTSHKIHLFIKSIEIDRISVNPLHNSSKNRLSQAPKISKVSKNFNFTSGVSVYAIVTYQGVFVPVSAFANYFSSLVQYIVTSINSDLQLFI